MKSTKRKDILHLESVPTMSLFLFARDLPENGRLQPDAAMSLKTDGANIKFGRDSDGSFFMESARSDVIYHRGDFKNYAMRNGKNIPLAEKYELLFTVLEKFVDSVFTEQQVGFKICSEVLFTPFGTVDFSNNRTKFVHLPYDNDKIGKILTIFPYSVLNRIGLPHARRRKLLGQLLATSGYYIKVIDPRLNCSAVEVPETLMRLRYNPHWDVGVKGATASGDEFGCYSDQLREGAVQLRDNILAALHSGNIPGYYSTGPYQEGVVVTTKYLGFKVTEPAFREMIKK